ncbi:MAG: terminase small subunit [Gammaproteobacteria bacterium]|nr:terminase small subunit [Gammaproteobacteria bacterium]
MTSPLIAVALKDRKLRFAKEFLIDRNRTQAARRAGYSEKTAHVHGCKLMKDKEVKAYIDKHTKLLADKLDLTAERVLTEIARLALSDPRKAFNADGTCKAITSLDDDMAAAIAGIEVVETGGEDQAVAVVKKIRLWDKKGALDLAVKHLGLGQPGGFIEAELKIKQLEIEKRELENALLRKQSESSEQANDADWLKSLVEHLPD